MVAGHRNRDLIGVLIEAGGFTLGRLYTPLAIFHFCRLHGSTIHLGRNRLHASRSKTNGNESQDAHGSAIATDISRRSVGQFRARRFVAPSTIDGTGFVVRFVVRSEFCVCLFCCRANF